jgi:CheY-like chemotaxis protein
LIIAYLAVGASVGFLAMCLALLSGMPIAPALAAYGFVGAVSTALVPVVLAAVDGQRNHRSGAERRDPEQDMTDAPQPLATQDVARPEERDVWRTIHILAVDDDDFILELLPKIAAKVGCPDVTTASSASSVLQIIRTTATPFDCFLVDINMPGMDGISLCTQIRSMPAYRQTPIIMLTAMTDMGHLVRAFRAGASDYTTKPFDIIDFGDRLRQAQSKIFARSKGSAKLADGATWSDESQTSGRHGPPLSGLTDLPALIDPTALGNFVARLSGPMLARTSLMAILLEVDHDSPAPHQGTALQRLSQVAWAIEEELGAEQYLMAVAGSDHFILAINAERLPDAPTLEAALLARLSAQQDGAIAADGPIRLTVGMPVRLNSQKANRARQGFETAVALARAQAIRGTRAHLPSKLQTK